MHFFEDEEKLEVSTKISSSSESNTFLRALRAELRRSFGKCAWHFSPMKFSSQKIVIFGFADLGFEHSVTIGMQYQRRDCIDKMLFWYQKLPEQAVQKIRSAVFNAKNKTEPSVILRAESYIEIADRSYTISSSGENTFTLRPATEGDRKKFLLDLIVSGFDSIDAATIAQGRIRVILDALAALSNLALYQGRLTMHNDSPVKRNFAVVLNEPPEDEFRPASHYAKEDGHFRMSSIEKNVIDLIIAGKHDDAQLNLWLQASNHFHMARKLEAQMTNKDFEELILVLYLSALEVGATIDMNNPVTCEICGHQKYEISKRVFDFVNTLSGKHMADMVKNLYVSRSKFLHVGHLLSTRNYLGTSIPQLDANHPSGCKQQSPSQIIDMAEVTSYCLRSLLKTFTYLHNPNAS